MIPKWAHVIWLGSEITGAQLGRINTFMDLNPEWHLSVWSESDIRFIDEAIGRLAYVSSKTHAGRSNILRMYILKECGGLYFDADVVWNKSIPDDFFGDETTLNASDERPDVFNTSVLAAPPNCPAVLDCIEEMKRRVFVYGTEPPYTQTGHEILSVVEGVSKLRGVSNRQGTDSVAFHLRDNSWKTRRGTVSHAA